MNQKGLTLIEVLVTLAIMAGGSVFILQALAQAARVGRVLEDRSRLYPVLSSKLAETEFRVPIGDPLKDTKGSFKQDGRNYEWSVKSHFMNPSDEKALKDGVVSSILVERVLRAGWMQDKEFDGLEISTLYRIAAPEKK